MSRVTWMNADFNNVEPDDEPEIPFEATCDDCRWFDPCPCGCDHGRCVEWGQWTVETCSGRDCGFWEPVV